MELCHIIKHKNVKTSKNRWLYTEFFLIPPYVTERALGPSEGHAGLISFSMPTPGSYPVWGWVCTYSSMSQRRPPPLPSRLLSQPFRPASHRALRTATSSGDKRSTNAKLGEPAPTQCKAGKKLPQGPRSLPIKGWIVIIKTMHMKYYIHR